MRKPATRLRNARLGADKKSSSLSVAETGKKIRPLLSQYAVVHHYTTIKCFSLTLNKVVENRYSEEISIASTKSNNLDRDR